MDAPFDSRQPAVNFAAFPSLTTSGPQDPQGHRLGSVVKLCHALRPQRRYSKPRDLGRGEEMRRTGPWNPRDPDGMTVSEGGLTGYKVDFH